MRKVWLAVLLSFFAACSGDLADDRVKEDFLRILRADYPGIEVASTERVAFGDGWGNGVEVVVSFVGTCKEAIGNPVRRDDCSREAVPMKMAMAYQKNASGAWYVLSASVGSKRVRPSAQ